MLRLPLNISDLVYFLHKNCKTTLKKVTPLFPSSPTLKTEICPPSLLKNLVGGLLILPAELEVHKMI